MKHPLIIAFSVIMTSSVMAETKVYGSMHSSFQFLSHSDNQSSNGLILNDAQFGVKGTKDLRADLSLIYQISWGVGTANFEGSKDKGIKNRNQIIGLASPKGAVIIGRFDTPFKTVGRKADLFWSSQLGQNRHITNAKNWDARADKIIVLQSPKFKGLQASAAYAMDIADTSKLTENASAISLGLNYKKKNLNMSAAYENHALKGLSGNRDAIRLVGSYKKKNVKYFALLQHEKNATKFTSEPDANVFGVGAALQQGSGTFKAHYYLRDSDSAEDKVALMAIGYDYKLSSQIDTYIQAAKLTGGVGFDDLDKMNNQGSVPANKGVEIGLRVKF